MYERRVTSEEMRIRVSKIYFRWIAIIFRSSFFVKIYWQAIYFLFLYLLFRMLLHTKNEKFVLILCRDVNETRTDRFAWIWYFQHASRIGKRVIRGKRSIREASIHLTANRYRRNEEGNHEIVIHRRMNRRSQTITERHLSIYNVRIQRITRCDSTINFILNERQKERL